MIRSISVRDLLTQYFKPQRLLGKSPQTIESYLGTINRIRNWHGGDLPTMLFDDERVAAFAEWLLAEGCRPATVNKHLRNLRALAAFGVKKGLVLSPLDIAMLPVDEEDPVCWSIDEVASILSEAVRMSGEISGLAASLWWECLVLLLLDAGTRISILMTVRMADLDLRKRLVALRPTATRGELEVRQKQRKGQTLAFSQQTADRLAAFVELQPAREMLFPWPFDLRNRQMQTLRRQYTRLLLRAGVAVDRKRKFHCLRKTTGTYLALALGIREAQRQLGHSHEKVTRAYVDPTKELPGVAAQPKPCDVIPRPRYSDGRQMELF